MSLLQCVLVCLCTSMQGPDPVPIRDDPANRPPVSDVPMFQVVTKIDAEKGTLTLGFAVTRPFQEKRLVTEIVNGREVKSYVVATVQKTVIQEQDQNLSAVKLYDRDGKELPRDQAIKDLKGKAVIVSSNGKMVKEAYRKLLAKDAVILVIPKP